MQRWSRPAPHTLGSAGSCSAGSQPFAASTETADIASHAAGKHLEFMHEYVRNPATKSHSRPRDQCGAEPCLPDELAKSSLDLLYDGSDYFRRMSLARTILAFLIAASVAILPATGGEVLKVSFDAAAASAPEAAHDCCPLDADLCKIDHCTTMAACALKCFNYTAISGSFLDYSFTVSNVIPSRPRVGFPSQKAGPPFRPPRA